MSQPLDPQPVEPVTPAALVAAARAAGHAPSIHNTQPWRWRVDGSVLDLFADRSRQLPVSDPEARLLVLSCGTALHHAVVALAAEGWRAEVERLPESGDPDHLARLSVTARMPVEAAAVRALQTIAMRRTDRRPVADEPVGLDRLARITRAVHGDGARLHLLARDQVVELAAAAAQAQRAESLDPRWVEELAYWVGQGHPEGAGLPPEVIPSVPPQTTVPGRDFGQPGTLPIGEGHDRSAAYAILYGDGDGDVDWLRAGEALSAAWLVATQLGLSLLPRSAAVEVTTTRETLRRLLSHLGHPYLVLRIGAPDPDHAGPPHTPRLPAEQTVEVVERPVLEPDPRRS
jgi:nitroreductase